MKSVRQFCIVVLSTLLASPAVALPGDPQAGREIASSSCASCHGLQGNSTSPRYPKLAGQSAAYIVKQLKDFKSGARKGPIMARQVKDLTVEEMKDVAAWYAQQTMTVEQANPEYVELGRRIWRGGLARYGVPACSGCHGPAGNGTAPAGFPALGGQFASYITEELKAFRNAGRNSLNGPKRNNDPNAVMRDIADDMTDKQIRAVASFASGLSRETSN